MSKYCRLWMAIVLIGVLAGAGAFGVASLASPPEASAAFLQSHNVAFIPSYSNPSVSPFPRTGTVGGAPSLSFNQFTFTDVPLASLTLANLANYDTVVLNQLSTSTLSSQQKADLNSWVDAGGKLIIYDSDGTIGNSYNWLIRPATTQPSVGQTGSMTGTLTIVEENTLSSNHPLSPYYINTAEVTQYTDAVGDCNVFATQDPNWFGDMQGTNVANHTGWTHAYAETPSGKGLIIYNGLDIDYIGGGYNPSGINWLAKIWYYELVQQWDPSYLPSTTPVSPSGIMLRPVSATLAVGLTQTMTANVTNGQGDPISGVSVTFTVTGNNTASGSATTDGQGIATWSYVGANEGTDTVQATATINSVPVTSNDAHITWTPGVGPLVPEASSFVLFGIGLLALGGVGMLVVLQNRRATA